MSKNRYFELIDLIYTFNKAYFIDDAPLIEDQLYDKYWQELLDIESKNPDLVVSYSLPRVGAMASSDLQAIEHLVPMLSLSNAFSKDDVLSFNKKILSILKEDAEIFG